MSATTNASAARRLERLLRYLDKTPTEFSRETGLDPSYVSRLKGGLRGGHGGNLHLKVSETYGLDPSYWTSPIEMDPAECIRRPRPQMPVPQAPRPPAPPAPNAGPQPVKEAIMELAIKRGDGPERMMAILRAMPPAGQENSLVWWVGFYVDLVAKG